jgi:hypothetical protein
MAKRSQITVGQEWAYKRSRHHEHTAWGGYEKAVIVAVEPYEKGYSKNYQVQKGNGVLIKIVSGYGAGYERVVQLSQLWKPWAEYEVAQAEFKVQWEISQAKAKVAKAEKEKFKEEVFNPALRELFQAIKPLTGGTYISGWTRLEELPIEVIQGITEAIKEKAVA